MTDIYEHPVSFNPKTRKFITVSGEHSSWLEAMEAVKNSLQEQEKQAHSK